MPREGASQRVAFCYFSGREREIPSELRRKRNSDPGGAETTAATPGFRMSSAGTIRNCVTGATTHWAMRMPRFTVKASEEIDEDHLHLAAIIAVDGAGAVQHRDSRESARPERGRTCASVPEGNSKRGRRNESAAQRRKRHGSFSAMAAARSKLRLRRSGKPAGAGLPHGEVRNGEGQSSSAPRQRFGKRAISATATPRSCPSPAGSRRLRRDEMHAVAIPPHHAGGRRDIIRHQKIAALARRIWPWRAPAPFRFRREPTTRRGRFQHGVRCAREYPGSR